VIRLSHNSGGPARPLNVGIAAATGEIIAVLDQDDVFAADKIERQARVLADSPEVALVAGLCTPWGKPGIVPVQQSDAFRLLGVLDAPQGRQLSGRSVLRVLVVEGNFLLGYPGFLFRKVHWKARGGLDERLRVGSDYDLLCWLCTRGSVVLLPAVHFVRREHDANACNDRQKMFLDLTRVRARYLASERLLEDEAINRPMREWFSAFGFWLREANNHRGAWECCRLAGRLWGWDGALLKDVCKLLLHRLRQAMAPRTPVYNTYTMTRASTNSAGTARRPPNAPCLSQ
jgi:glycosyltransferase involved in cell wall biosynthesis